MIFHRGSATRSVWDCNENQTDVPTAPHNKLFNLTIAPKPESGREIRISDKQSPCTRSLGEQLEPRAGWKKTLKEQHFEKASDMDRATIMATTIMTDMDRATFGNILSSPRCTKASLTIFGQEAIFGLGALSQRNHYIVIINNGSRFVNIGQTFNIITITIKINLFIKPWPFSNPPTAFPPSWHSCKLPGLLWTAPGRFIKVIIRIRSMDMICIKVVRII